MLLKHKNNMLFVSRGDRQEYKREDCQRVRTDKRRCARDDYRDDRREYWREVHRGVRAGERREIILTRLQLCT